MRPGKRRGMALLATLVVLAILVALTASLAFAVRTESTLAAGEVRRVQAQWLAESGLQRAVLELRDRPEPYLSLLAEAETDSGRPLVLRLDSSDEPDLTPEGEGFVVEGLDESARLNINSVPEEVLNRLLPTEPELVEALLDWRDEDDLARPEGAEAEYYATLDPAHAPRNGPLETIEEMLLIKGVTPGRFFGELGLSPLADETEREQIDPMVSPLANLFSIDTFDDNVDSSGQARIDLKEATRQTLMEAFEGVLTDAEVASITAWAEESEAPAADAPSDEDPLPQTPMPNPDPMARPTPQAMGEDEPTESDPPAPDGSDKPVSGLISVLSREKLRQVYDRLTMSSDDRVLGLINVNTAAPEILAALPGMDEATAQALVQAREQSPFETVGDLLGLTEVTNEQFERVAPWLTTRGQTVRLVATGTVGEGREAVQRRVTAVVLVEITPAAQGEEGAEPSGHTAADSEAAAPTRSVRLVYHRVD